MPPGVLRGLRDHLGALRQVGLLERFQSIVIAHLVSSP
jgi:hypothetical protein